MTRLGRRGPLLVAVLAVVLPLVAGCGGLPLAAGVQVQHPVTGGSDQADVAGVRVLPPRPAAGATPTAIVRGFLNAQSDDEDDYGIARDFLAPGTTWDTAGPASVYGSATYPTPEPAPAASPSTPAAGRTAAVTVVLGRSASLDATGVYTPRDDQVTVTFRLMAAGGAWRITNPPAGLELTAGDLQRTYLPATLWWFAPDLTMLVPEIRWLPLVASGRQTQLVRALLAGPSAGLAQAVRTAVPAGVTLDGSVSTVGSDVVVDLSQSAAVLDARQARLLLVQLASTLQQVQTGTAVRLEVDGQPLPAAAAPQRLTLSAATPYDPDNDALGAPTLALAHDKVVAAAGTAAIPAAATALAGRDLAVAVPAPAGGAVAAVEHGAGGERVLVVDATGAVRTVATGDSFGTPTWSYGGTLLVPSGRDLLRVEPGAATASPVAVPAGLGALTSVRFARDGVRVLLAAGGHAYLTTLVAASGAVSLEALLPISTGLGTVTAVGWQSATTVAVLSSPDGGPPALVELDIDGSLPDTIPLPAAVGTADVSLAVAAGVPLLVAGAGAVEQLTGDDVWRPAASGRAPAAPG